MILGDTTVYRLGARLVDRAARARVDSFYHVDDARAAQLLPVAVGPARERLVDVDLARHLRAGVCAWVQVYAVWSAPTTKVYTR